MTTQDVRESTGTYFRVVVDQRDGRSGHPRDIMFQPVPNAAIPAPVAELQIEIERTLTALNMLFPYIEEKAAKARDQANNGKFDLYFEKLVGIAVMGLGQDQPAFGKMSLDNLKEEIRLRESGRVKNAYVRRLGYWVLGFILPLVAFYLAMRLGCAGPASVSCGFLPDWIGVKREFVTLLAGSLLGTWLSFAIRKVELRFSELSVVENDQLDPPIRLLFVAGLTLVVGLIFSTKMATITIGGFDTHFLNAGTHALLIGLFCGIAEHSLAPTVGARAGEFIGRLATPPKGGEAGAKDPPAPINPDPNRFDAAKPQPKDDKDAAADGKKNGDPAEPGKVVPAKPADRNGDAGLAGAKPLPAAGGAAEPPAVPGAQPKDDAAG